LLAEFDPPPLFVNALKIKIMVIIQSVRFVFFKCFAKKWWAGSIRTNDLASAKNIGGSANVWWQTLFIGLLNRVLTPLEISFLTGLIEGGKRDQKSSYHFG
jgi:hypothetical protein